MDGVLKNRGRGAVIALLLALLVAQLVWGLVSDGLTIDELVYIGSGYRHASASDYRMAEGYPPLAIMLGATPLLFMDLNVPQPKPLEVWGWSYRFVHVDNDAGRIVSWARAPIVALTLVLALLVWAWARSASGDAAGLVALCLVAFHPSLLAHGHLLTTDLAAALTMAFASWAFWRWSKKPGLFRAALVGLAVGFAVTTRLTGWLLLPAFALLEALRWGGGSWREWPRRAREALVLLGAGAAVVVFVIWAAYGFHYAPWPGASVAKPPQPWLGAAGPWIARLQQTRLLPEAYVETVRFQVEHTIEGHPGYMLGHTSNTGWREYYLVAFLAKNTPGFLLVTAGTLVLVARRWRRLAKGGVEAHWLVPAAVTFLAASFGRIQIGERYILAAYPYLILLASSFVPWLRERRRGPAVLAGLLVLHAVPTLTMVRRGYLPYFNFLAGGPAGGHRILVDSNLDWGQDLPRLAAWMRRHGVEQVQLGYHGSDDPARYGIRHEDLPGIHLFPTRAPARPFSGVVAVSPNLLLGVYYQAQGNPYSRLLARPPDDRAGVFFVYRLPSP